MMNAQWYAVEIERIMRDAFECERFGIGCFVNSDYIRSQPFTAMMSTLTYLYGKKGAASCEIVSKFFETYCRCSERSIDQFSAPNCTNGEDAIKDMISAFGDACKQLK